MDLIYSCDPLNHISTGTCRKIVSTLFKLGTGIVDNSNLFGGLFPKIGRHLYAVNAAVNYRNKAMHIAVKTLNRQSQMQGGQLLKIGKHPLHVGKPL